MINSPRPCRVMQGERNGMKNRYWFTDENGENILNDFCGTEEEAIEYAQGKANKLGKMICINCGEDIIDFVYAD